jgi:hypothetical protein
MPMQGLEGSRLLLLMAFGAVSAVAGLFLLFRPPKTEGETRIELLGMKFNAASGGVLVFLVGAAFLALPIFVPEKRSTPPAGSSTTVSANNPVTQVAAGDLPVRKRAAGREVERNDSFDTANRIEVGASVAGNTKDSEDWYILPLDKDKTALELRLRTNSGACLAHVYSSDEQKLIDFNNTTPNTSETRQVSLPGSSAVLVMLEKYDCTYELFSDYASG